MSDKCPKCHRFGVERDGRASSRSMDIWRCVYNDCGYIKRVKINQTTQEKVKDFHLKHKFTVGSRITDKEQQFPGVKEDLEYCYDKLKVLVKSLALSATNSQSMGDDRLYRVYTMLEELTEIVDAMANGNEVELADGLADLEYFLHGTAVVYDIPLQKVFDEVHRSNMTKMLRDPKTNQRMRDKGPDYIPPDIAGVIAKYREENKDVDN